MPWIKIDTNLASKPEVFQIARKCRTPRPTVVGHLVMFWGWVDTISPDGEHIEVAGSDIDDVVGLKGFAAAMVEVGWLAGADGDFSIPRFDRHNGNSAKARWLEAEAKRIRRMSDRTSDSESDTCPTEPPPNVRPEKRREEKKEEGAARAPAREGGQVPQGAPAYHEEDWRVTDAKRYPLPEGFETPGIRTAWVGWIEYLVGRFGPSAVSMATLQQHIAKLKQLGPPNAVEALRNAASKNFREPCLPLAASNGQMTGRPQGPQQRAKVPVNDRPNQPE